VGCGGRGPGVTPSVGLDESQLKGVERPGDTAGESPHLGTGEGARRKAPAKAPPPHPDAVDVTEVAATEGGQELIVATAEAPVTVGEGFVEAVHLGVVDVDQEDEPRQNDPAVTGEEVPRDSLCPLAEVAVLVRPDGGQTSSVPLTLEVCPDTNLEFQARHCPRQHRADAVVAVTRPAELGGEDGDLLPTLGGDQPPQGGNLFPLRDDVLVEDAVAHDRRL
jgi:hypothetical protein